MEIDDLISIGKVSKIGNSGQLVIIPDTDFPEHFKTLSYFFLVTRDQHVGFFDIATCALSKNKIIITVADTTPSDLKNFLYSTVMINEEQLYPLDDKNMYQHEAIGYHIILPTNEDFGEVVDIFPTGAHDVLVVKHHTREVFIPFCDAFIKHIDKKQHFLYIIPIEGLLDAY